MAQKKIDDVIEKAEPAHGADIEKEED